MQEIFRYVDQNRERFLGELFALLRQPSTSAASQGVTECAALLKGQMEDIGIPARILSTAGHPVVYGEVKAAGAIGAGLISAQDPYDQAVTGRLKPPVWMEGGSREHLLGTDPVGRDILARIIYGSRISLATGAASVVISVVIGVLLGLVGGYYGGKADSVVTNLVNVMMAFPFILLALTAVAVMGPSFKNMVIVLGVTGWPIYTRVVRAETAQLKTLEFVVAARAIGFTNLRIIARHILPNVFNTIVVTSSLEVARMIILESILSFLGLGVQPPTPSWGGMLGEGRTYLLTHWWLATFPGIAIFVTTLGINLLGDGLRDALDPHQY